MTKKFGELLNEFQNLDLSDGEYAIFGSGPLAVRGLREAGDLDIVVTDSLYQKLKEKYPEKEKGTIKLGKIEIISPQNSIIENPQGIIKRAELIKGLRFVRLEDIIVWKKKMGREKDFKDIKLIEEYFKNE